MYDFDMSSKYKKDLINILGMLSNIEKDLDLIKYNDSEKKVYYTIARKISSDEVCNISDIINDSGLSRSTVYKSIKKFELDNLLSIHQSNDDKREFNLVLS